MLFYILSGIKLYSFYKIIPEKMQNKNKNPIFASKLYHYGGKNHVVATS